MFISGDEIKRAIPLLDDCPKVKELLMEAKGKEFGDFICRDSYPVCIVWQDEDFENILRRNHISPTDHFITLLKDTARRSMQDVGIAAGWEAMYDTLKLLQNDGKIPESEGDD